MDELGYYRLHSPLSDPGAQRRLFDGLSSDVGAMAKVVGGVLVHRDHAWRFGFSLPQERRAEANTRYVEAILDHLGTLDERRPQDRFAGTCRDFTVLLCAMLREAGVPARARAGFAGYFTEGFFDDHWVVEVWDDGRGWRLVDAQVASAPEGTYGRVASTRWMCPATHSWWAGRRGRSAGPGAGIRTGSAPAPRA
jgi:Transglutaminase-like superfamily